MSITDAFQIAQAVLVALGGGGILVFALSSWLGKVWANRLMAKETAKYEGDIEHLKAQLKEQLDRNSHTYRKKIELYKEASEPIIDLIVKVEHNQGLQAKRSPRLRQIENVNNGTARNVCTPICHRCIQQDNRIRIQLF